MKKIFILSFLLFPLVLNSCGTSIDSQEEHLVHHYEADWNYDESNHWHACIDDGFENLKSNEETHSFNEVVTPSTLLEGGYTTYTCSICGFSYVDNITKAHICDYNLSRPEEGEEVSEISIPLKDGSKATVEKDMDINSFGYAIVENLNSFDQNNPNWDCCFKISANDETEQIYNLIINNKRRYSHEVDKEGFYIMYDSNDFLFIVSSYHPRAFAIHGFTSIRDNEQFLCLLGNIPPSSTIEYMNARESNPFLSEDSDYEPGKYYKEGVPTSLDVYSAPEVYRGCMNLDMVFNISDGGWLSPSYLLKADYRYELLKPIISYKLTNKYLILEIERPYGILHRLHVMGIQSLFDEMYQKAIENSCYFRETMFFDISQGALTYIDVSFKTYDYLDRYKSGNLCFEGTFTIKVQTETDEAYTVYQNHREEVMRECINHKDY